jgi:hypothetical protein
MEGDLDIGFPVHCELLPGLLMQRGGGRKRASTENQDIRLQHIKHFRRRAFIGCVERENFGSTHLPGQFLEWPLLSRHREHAGAIADRGFNDLPSDTSAAADHDDVFT